MSGFVGVFVSHSADSVSIDEYEGSMKIILLVACSVLILTSAVLAEGGAQTFATSAGPVVITPLNHASTRIEAGGKVIYLDPAKPVDFAKGPKADLILITDIHGDHMDPDAVAALSKAG